MKSDEQPTLDIVAGPNGSGKTIFAQSYIVRSLKRSNYLNPDVIMAGVSPTHSSDAAIQAGRIFLHELKARIANGSSVSFESTLSGKTYINLIREARSAGYFVTIYFVYTQDVKTNISRIQKRVKMGGHLIKSIDVKRRYSRAFLNFWNIYRHLADDWMLFDNSGARPKLFCSKSQFLKLSKDKASALESKFMKFLTL